MQVAARLLADEAVPLAQRRFLAGETGAFLLGNVAADARVSSGLRREHTHFYSYDAPITEHPWRVLFRTHPGLTTTTDPAHRAFLAGYVAHLTMDEVWALEMARPHFHDRDWVSPAHRFLFLHIILSYMDARDYRLLPAGQRDALLGARPSAWLPFMSDTDLANWRDYIGGQLPPGGTSQTLDIFAQRVNLTAQHLRDILTSETRMHEGLWQYIGRDVLARVEANMYRAARHELGIYLTESEPTTA